MTLNTCYNDVVHLSLLVITPAVFAAGATWLVSSISNPLVAGTIAAVSVLATLMFKKQITKLFGATDNEEKGKVLFLTIVALPVVLSSAWTVIGFPISSPLSLLLSLMTVAGFAAGHTIFESCCGSDQPRFTHHRPLLLNPLLLNPLLLEYTTAP